MPPHTLGQMPRHRRLFPQWACRHGDLGKIHAQQHPTQAPTRRTAVPIPKARGHCHRSGRHRGQDIARQQRQLRETVAALSTAHERPVRTEHLLGRQGDVLHRPAGTGQTPQCRGRHRQVGRQHPWFLGARSVDHHTWERHGTRLGRGEHQVVPDLGVPSPPGYHPLRGGIWGCGGTGLALVGAGEGADPCPIRRATPPALGGGQDVASGRKVARQPQG